MTVLVLEEVSGEDGRLASGIGVEIGSWDEEEDDDRWACTAGATQTRTAEINA